MRAKKSSKNLLRISGLALVFMLAVALLVSAISFTRVGAIDNKTAFAAGTYTPGTQELAIGSPSWNWNVPLKADADGNIAVYTYRPNTYKNYFSYVGGIYSTSVESSDTSANTSHVILTGSVRERLYAYYKLPDELVSLGATIEISANLDSAYKFTSLKETATFISVADSVKKIEENEDTDKLTAEQIVDATYNLGTSWKVTAGRQYILVYAGGQVKGTTTSKIEISGLEITIKVKSVDNPSFFTPVTAAWDGKTKPDIAISDTIANISNLYTTNNNIVGNLDWALNGEDALDPTFNKLTSIRTDGTQTKQFSFLLFDKFFGLKEADIKGFDILQAYIGEGAITDGSAKTYRRSDYTLEQLKTLRYPTGLESITVEPFAFDNNDPATGSFRGLYVTVIYDGKDNNALPIETDTIYRVNYKNSINLSGKTLSVDCDGIDYTKPTALNEVALLTESVFNENDGVTYFYTDTIKFKPVLEDTDTRGDVKYFYTLYKIVDGNYVEIEGQVGIAINNPGSDIFTFSGLEKGEYAIRFKAIDTVGLFYENLVKDKTPEQIEGLNLNPVQQGWANHAVYSDYHHFTIDDIKSLPEKWETAIYLENGGAYNGEWTNQNVVIEFNTLSSIKDITYQISYRTLKNGVFVGTQTDWVSINDKIVDNKYIIGHDEISPEGYERIYYFQAIYNSSNITYTVDVPVKYDNYNGYKPEIARLLDFSTDAYADLLPLLVNLNYKQVGKDGYVSEFLGSPMTLYYAITRDGVVGEAKELSLDTNDVYMDLFEGRNVSGLTQIQVRFWLVDEAGNTNEETIYNVNLDRAKINVNFNIDTNARRYFNNTTDVSTSLVSYTLSNKFTGTIPSGKIGITFDAAYDDVNAGARNVRISNIKAAYVEGSAYTKELIEEYEKVYVNADGEVITPEADGSYVIGTHEIRKARLTIDEKYRHAPFVYNGTINYAMTDYVSGDGSLLVLDKVLGDKADEWKNIQWKGTFQLDSIAVNPGLRASLINIEIAGELNNNYQITNAGGSASAPKAYIDIQKAKLGKITIIASKVYNGENTILTNSDNCTFSIAGLQGTDNITLDNGTIIILDKDGRESKDVGTYTFNVNVTDFKLVGARLDFYDTTDVTVEATVTVTKKPITVTVNNVDKPFDNKKEFQISSYSFGGVVTGDDVKLLTSTGNTEYINVGTYPGCKVTLGLSGNDSKNYVLKDTEAVVTVTISPREIGGAKITGIYAVDKNGNYYYINKIGGNVVIYQKDGAGYIEYSRDENGKAQSKYVPTKPDGATEWVLDTFVKDGVCIINGHRFELAQEAVYAIEYYEDTELKNKLDIGAIDFKERQYQPVVVDQNGNKFVIDVDINTGVYDTTSGAYQYTLKIENFGAKSNFKKITGFNDTETKVVSVLDFSDVKFENKMFNEKGSVDKFSAPYNAKAYTLNVIRTSPLDKDPVAEYFKKDADGVWQPVSAAIDAGVYYGKFTVSRLNNEYIIEQTFTIEKIGTEIKIKDASVTYDAKYGEDFAEKVQKVDDAFNYYKTTYGMVVGANDIVYEYSFDEDFKTILGSAPVRQGGGVCYVRVIYKGNENFIGSVSLARKINVNGAKFNLVDITANVGESFNLPTVENLIDKDSVGGNYKEIAKDFVIVYRVSDASYKVVNNAAGLVGEGRYPYRVVHKGLIKGGAWTVDSSAESERYTRAVSADGIIEATISITENELNSVWGGDVNVPDDKVREPNGIGTISGSWTQADSGYKVYFCILDRNNATIRDNFTNGLRQNKEIFGKEYAAGKVYFLSLSEYKNNSFLMNPDKQPRLMSPATVTMNVRANGAKLIRYNNGEWTEVNYVDNGDGTVTFETDKLGYFIFAEDYVAPKAKTNTLAIGIGAGVGGAAVLMAIIVVTLVVIKRKRA
ncbi:MAG: YDG domain-containing protein [Clostridiales bacterium]|nr:YDG domain-containing protein [Clostridiales bacterium]